MGHLPGRYPADGFIRTVSRDLGQSGRVAHPSHGGLANLAVSAVLRQMGQLCLIGYLFYRHPAGFPARAALRDLDQQGGVVYRLDVGYPAERDLAERSVRVISGDGLQHVFIV
jgi:hypothetical protein